MAQFHTEAGGEPNLKSEGCTACVQFLESLHSVQETNSKRPKGHRAKRVPVAKKRLIHLITRLAQTLLDPHMEGSHPHNIWRGLDPQIISNLYGFEAFGCFFFCVMLLRSEATLHRFDEPGQAGSRR